MGTVHRPENGARNVSDKAASAPPQSRTEYVTSRIKEDVANGVITPGELIKQTVLAKRYGVSPTPVREAMRILEADGVITYAPHKGASVREMSPEGAHDLYRMRAAAEYEATEMAASRMTPQILARAEAKYQELSDALADEGSTAAELSILNKQFHFAIYEASSPVVVQYLELLWTRFTPPTTIFRDHKAAMKLHREHKEILKAVKSGNTQKAAELASAHTLGAWKMREEQPAVRPAGQINQV